MKMKALKFLREVKSEAKKVTWANFAQTRMLTIIVTIISVLIALYLLLVDNLLQAAIDFFVKF
jgi:preprotein translocase SecE subunit|tara:strand:- start:315 stop:503 length:189 start_codon:yes stop_codon:yes gene_type:complete